MTGLWLLASLGGFLALGAAFGLRYSDKARDADPDIARFVLSIPPDAWDEDK